MKYADIRRLVKLVESSNIAELEIEEGTDKVRISKVVPPSATSATLPQFIPLPAGLPPSIASTAATPEQVSVPKATAIAATGEAPTVKKLIEVQSPMVGTFYRAPAPEAPPYVQVGDRVKPGKVLCIIEAMKLMNEIESEVSGVVAEILVENAQPVEFGQILFRIDPS